MRRRETIADPRIKALILRAVRATHYPGTTPQRFYDEHAAGIADDRLGLFVGFNPEREPRAVAIVRLPNSENMWAPVANLVYSECRDAAVQIGARVRAWVQRHEYDRVLGMNLYHDDEAFCRTFRHMGDAVVIGSVVEVRF